MYKLLFIHQQIGIPEENGLQSSKPHMPFFDLGLICQKEVIEDVVGYLLSFNTFIIIIICKSF